MSEQQYEHLTHEDTIQAGDEFWTGSVWLEYDENHIGKFVLVDPSRRPIANAIDPPKPERIAYEELRPGDIIQKGDEWYPKDGTGKWQAYHQGMFGLQVFDASIARRPYRVSTILEIGDALVDAQKTATQLQNERNNALTDLKSAQRARDELQLQVDELRADRERLQGLIDDLLDEPTAKQVQDMLRTWLTELDWSIGCFGSFGRSQIDIIEQTMVTVINRISSMIDQEGDSNDN